MRCCPGIPDSYNTHCNHRGQLRTLQVSTLLDDVKGIMWVTEWRCFFLFTTINKQNPDSDNFSYLRYLAKWCIALLALRKQVLTTKAHYKPTAIRCKRGLELVSPQIFSLHLSPISMASTSLHLFFLCLWLMAVLIVSHSSPGPLALQSTGWGCVSPFYCVVM